MKLLAAWFWESLENLPMLFGFVVASRLWPANIPAGLVVLAIGMGTGVLVTRLVEPRLHKAKHAVRWVSVIVNFVLFFVLAIPFLYYIRADTRWTNWVTDILGGLAAGLLLTFVQSLHWTGPKSRMLLHGAAMMVAFPTIMLGLRVIIRADSWGLSMFFTFLLTLFGSLIIALIDYQELYRGVK
jgi:hypothetical protein